MYSSRLFIMNGKKTDIEQKDKLVNLNKSCNLNERFNY